MKIKPIRLLEILEKKGLHVPKKQQLSSYLISLRKKYYGASTISLDELEAWCQRNSLIPDDDEKPWVLKYQIEYEDEINKDDDNDNGDHNDDDDNKNKFRFFVTTRRFCLRDDLLNLSLQMNEQELILIADDAEVISNAFLKVFGTDHNVVMCWFHMRKNVEKNLYLVENKALHGGIMNDIETLQLSTNKNIFDIATRLFLKSGRMKTNFFDIFHMNG
ncbi:unnamed protein product [Rotaria socialis]|uniref:MULE transposase domain-containing protein n=1 Tax=Rotaria socialis TaxID=392032 RepID=A0A821CV78_9BILA|nr:unnamed protein product [Rotaria socialis]